MSGRTHTLRHLLLAAAVLAFFGATVGTAFGMTTSSSDDKRHTTAQHASQEPPASPSGAPQSAEQQAATGDQTGADNAGTQDTNPGNGNPTTTQKVSVPWVTNQNESYARDKIKDAGLTVGQVKYVCVDGKDPGTVTDQSPNGDTQATKNSKVSLKVQGVKVQNVVGVYHADAKSQLEHDGLKVVEKDLQPGDAGGAVSAQNPSGGSCVKPGATVTITVGTTTDPSTSPSADAGTESGE